MQTPPVEPPAASSGSTGALYPEKIKLSVTKEMRQRLEAQAELHGGLSMQATIRLGLHRWLTAAEGANKRREP